MFGAVGGIVSRLSTKDRARAAANLRRVFGGKWSEEDIRRTARRVYVELGKNAFDALYLPRCSDEEFFSLVTHDDFGAYHRARSAGCGVVMMAGHIGCFEIPVHLFSRKGYKGIAVGAELFDRRLDRMVRGLRHAENVIYLHRSGSSRAVLRALKEEGRTLGMLIDQDTKVAGVFAHFLGIPAYTPSAPMRMAMRHNLPVFVCSLARQPDDRHHFYLHGPVELDDTGDFTRDLVMNAEKVNAILSKAILRHPEQWVWMHRRWGRSPDQEQYRDVPNVENYMAGESVPAPAHVPSRSLR